MRGSRGGGRGAAGPEAAKLCWNGLVPPTALSPGGYLGAGRGLCGSCSNKRLYAQPHDSIRAPLAGGQERPGCGNEDTLAPRKGVRSGAGSGTAQRNREGAPCHLTPRVPALNRFPAGPLCDPTAQLSVASCTGYEDAKTRFQRSCL